MCPISGLVQFLIVIVTLLLLCHTFVANALNITHRSKEITVTMYDVATVEYYVSEIDNIDPGGGDIKLYSEDPHIALLEKEVIIKSPYRNFNSTFNVTGNFLGQTVLRWKYENSGKLAGDALKVTVKRKNRPIDTAFTVSVATLVSIIYINFGCALNWGELRSTLRRPIGPVIGFFGQFVIMPLLSYGLGKWLFPDNPEMQLGMFFTGVSPAGGASNIWTVILGGNMDLSITMTTISTFAAFGMMPLWIFTLGKTIFDQGNLAVPYSQISMYAIGLVIPLGIGYLISRYFKKVSRFLVRILKGFSSLLILFIIIFAVVTNLYLFELFSWQIVVAGMCLPYLGYLSAYAIAHLLKQPPPDCLAIAIETGIQNTGIAIFLLRFTLPQPQGDLTTVAPVSVAIMTPFPLIALFIYKKIRERMASTHHKLEGSDTLRRSGEIDVDSNFNSGSHKSQIPSIS